MIAPYSYPPVCAESLVTAKLILAMVEDGWKIDVISSGDSTHDYPSGDKKQKWQKVAAVTHQLSCKSSTRFGQLLWLIKAILVGYKLIRSNNYTVIASRATPLFGHVPALVLRIIFRIPWMTNWSDPVPQRMAPPPYGEGVNASPGFLQKIYLNLISKFSNVHTFPCVRLQRYYGKYLPKIKSSNSLVVPHVALSSFGEKLLCDQLDSFRLCYTGSLILRPVDVLFQALKQFQISYPQRKISAHFVVSDIAMVEKKANEYLVGSMISSEKTKSYQETQKELLQSNVILVIEALCDEGIFLPSKVADIVQIGTPILALSPKKGTLSDILRSGGGLAVDNQSVDDVLRGIENLYQAWKDGCLLEKYSSCNLLESFGEQAVLSQVTKAIQMAKTISENDTNH